MKNIILFLTVLCLFFTSHSYAQDPPSQSVGVARLTPEVRSAISKGLEYLAKDDLQKADGSWGGSQNRVAETSLTLMAFMLQGHVPGRGQYGRAMENAISFLPNIGCRKISSAVDGVKTFLPAGVEVLQGAERVQFTVEWTLGDRKRNKKQINYSISIQYQREVKYFQNPKQFF